MHIRLRGWSVVLIAGLWVSPSQMGGQVEGNPPSEPRFTSPQKTTLKYKPAVKSSGKSLRVSRRRRRENYRYRLARLRPEPQRVAEIQRGLIQAGYLNHEPTGTWDDPTREAMRRFQQDHGFPVTGLPDAKSLMKLGLGPHPLPEDVDPSVASRASADATAKPAPVPANQPLDQQPATKDPIQEKQ